MQKPTPYRFVVEALLFLLYAVFGLSWIAITPLIGEIQAAYHINGAEFGLVNTLVSLAKVVAPVLTGLVAVRLGLKRTVMLGAAFISVAAIAPFAPDFKLFLVSRFLFGIGGAMVVTMMSAAVMDWFPKDELPLVNALNNVAVNTGITVTLFTTVPLAGRFGWRNTLVGYGLVSVALLVAWAVLGKERTAKTEQAASTQTARYADVWRMKETWIIALSFAGPLALYLAFNTWLPKYYIEAFGMTKAAASQYTGFFNLMGIPTAIIAGFLTKQFGLRRPFIIGSGVLMGAAAFGMFLFHQPALLMASAVALGISLFAYVSPLFTIPMELEGMNPQKVSLMMGTVFSVAYVFSSLSPVVVGSLHDATHSFVPGFTLWAVFSWILAIGGLVLPETGPRRKARNNERASIVPASGIREEERSHVPV